MTISGKNEQSCKKKKPHDYLFVVQSSANAKKGKSLFSFVEDNIKPHKEKMSILSRTGNKIYLSTYLHFMKHYKLQP